MTGLNLDSGVEPATHRKETAMRTRTTPTGGRLGYGAAVLVAVVGVTTAALWGVTGVLDQVQQPEGFVRADLSNGVFLTLSQVGPHVIYYEGHDPTTVSADQVRVVDAGQRAVPVRPYRLDLRYDVPGKPGVLGTAIAVFDADRTGSFVIRTDSTGSPDAMVQDAHAQLAVGDDLAPGTIRAIAIPGLAALLSLIAAITLAARTWSRRERRSQP
jgi:hypothetical protein